MESPELSSSSSIPVELQEILPQPRCRPAATVLASRADVDLDLHLALESTTPEAQELTHWELGTPSPRKRCLQRCAFTKAGFGEGVFFQRETNECRVCEDSSLWNGSVTRYVGESSNP